jgi:hypothetical protein
MTDRVIYGAAVIYGDIRNEVAVWDRPLWRAFAAVRPLSWAQFEGHL